jgi:hypothetical protein
MIFGPSPLSRRDAITPHDSAPHQIAPPHFTSHHDAPRHLTPLLGASRCVTRSPRHHRRRAGRPPGRHSGDLRWLARGRRCERAPNYLAPQFRVRSPPISRRGASSRRSCTLPPLDLVLLRHYPPSRPPRRRTTSTGRGASRPPSSPRSPRAHSAASARPGTRGRARRRLGIGKVQRAMNHLVLEDGARAADVRLGCPRHVDDDPRGPVVSGCAKHSEPVLPTGAGHDARRGLILAHGDAAVGGPCCTAAP